MIDQYAGHAGEFVNDPETGTRIPLTEWQAKQAKAAPPKPIINKQKEEL